MAGISWFQECAAVKFFSLSMRLVFRLLVLSVVAGSLAAAQQAAPKPPMIPSGEMRKLTAHTYAIEDKDTTPGVPNVGFVVGSRGVLVIDTGMGPRNGKVVAAEAQKLAPGHQLYLVTTHVHPEHDLGAEAFPQQTKMIRSADQEKDIAQYGLSMANTFIARSTVNAELLTGANFRTADIHFDKSYDLDLGGVAVRILAMGPNHTRGDTAVWVPSDRVLFSGDVAMKGLPSFASPDSSVKQWLASLQTFAALKPAIVVPSHGPIGDASYVTGYQSLLTTVRDRTAALKRQGKSLDEVTSTLTAELKPKYADTNRLAGAIRAAYAEAS